VRPVNNSGIFPTTLFNFPDPIKILQRIAFVKSYLKMLEDPKKLLLVIDEVGIGTSLLRNYAYSKKGERVVVILILFLLANFL